MKYRKKTHPFEATQWFKNGDHPDDYKQVMLAHDTRLPFSGAERKKLGWEGEVVRYCRQPDVRGNSVCSECNRLMHDHGWLDGDGYGCGIVCPGSYIAKINGLYYTYNKSFFEANFDLEPEPEVVDSTPLFFHKFQP